MSDGPRARRKALPSERRRSYSLWRLILANIYDLFRLLRRSGVAIVGFIVVVSAAALYLHFLIPLQDLAGQQQVRLQLPEAYYEALKLLIFQSSLQLPKDTLGQVIFFLVPILGLLLVVQSVLSFGRGFLDKGSRLQSWQVSLAATYRQHVIVCGLGRVGYRVVSRLLDAGYEPVVIEQRWEGSRVADVVRRKVPVIVGDATDAATLRQAGAHRALAVIASIDGDLTDIEIGLAVRAVKPDIRVILRAFDEELDQRLEHTFGHESAFSTSALAAPTFTAATISRDLDYIVPLGPGGEMLGVARIEVRAGGGLPATLDELEARYTVRVLGASPRDGGRLRPGMVITTLGTLPALEAARLSNLQGTPEAGQLQHPTAERDTILICGLGKVGFRVVRRLYALNPRPRIVVISNGETEERFQRVIAQMPEVTLIHGDATDAQTLRDAGLDRAYSVAALTSNDEVNLRIGLAARSVRENVHVVLRVFSDALADQLVTMFGIHTAYSTSDLAGPTLAAAAILGEVSRAFYANETLFAADSVVAARGGRIAGRTIADIRKSHGVLVAALRRGGQAFPVPLPETLLAEGDTLVLVASLASLRKLRAGNKALRPA